MTKPRSSSPLRRWVTLAAATLLFLLAGALPAAAHVTVETAEPLGDGSVRITFSFNHACTDSPTTAVTTVLPAGSVAEAVEPPPGWDGTIDAETVSLSGPAIPGDQEVTYAITARLTGSIGSAVLFPTTQVCANGEAMAWTDAEESGDEPAPRLIATAAVLDQVTPAAGIVVDAGDGAGTVEVAVAIGLFTVIGAVAMFLYRRTQHHRADGSHQPTGSA